MKRENKIKSTVNDLDNRFIMTCSHKVTTFFSKEAFSLGIVFLEILKYKFN